MKRIISLAFTLLLTLTVFALPAFASEIPLAKVESYVENCDGDGFFVIEVGTYETMTRSSTKSGYKTATYYSGSGNAVWAVRVDGNFYYNGTSSSASSASATVYTYNSKAQFVSKNAYVSGSSAIGNATMKYGTANTYKSVTLTCDKNGNLS